MAKKKAARETEKKSVETITHAGEKRRIIPTAEMESVVQPEHKGPLRVEYVSVGMQNQPVIGG